MNPDRRRYRRDIERYVNDFVLKKYEKRMPLRLIDTYTGLVLTRSEITSLLKKREEYHTRLEHVWQATHGVEHQSQLPLHLSCLQAFVAEYMAFAMFSHRWGPGETTLADVREATGGIYSIVQAPSHLPDEEARNFRAGARKLQEFCCTAAKCGFRWAWADTCCMDNQVYGEKSESINSMFQWYRNSDLTIVYLGDVEDVPEGRLWAVDGHGWLDDSEIRSPLPTFYPYSNSTNVITLRDCGLPLQSLWPDTQVNDEALEVHLRSIFHSLLGEEARGISRNLPVWLTRGWTLQELLASKRVRFYSKDWRLLEEADDHPTSREENEISIPSFKPRARLVDHRVNSIWCKVLENSTGISRQNLTKFEPGTRDVRSRLQWAARRTTTEVEDMAYCLLGIFDITLPAAYGEGDRAFIRLQEELMKRTNDTSLFDWCGHRSPVNSFLAHGPQCFIAPNLQPSLNPHPYEPSGSIFRTIIALLGEMSGISTTGIQAVVKEERDAIRNILDIPLFGHTLINGELNLLLLEYKVKRWQPLGYDTLYRYNLEVDGMETTSVTFDYNALDFWGSKTELYLCHVWDSRAVAVYRILLDLVEYVLKDAFNEMWNMVSTAVAGPSDHRKAVINEADNPDPKEENEMQMKLKQVLGSWNEPLTMYLVYDRDGVRVRLNTFDRVTSKRSGFRFEVPVARVVG